MERAVSKTDNRIRIFDKCHEDSSLEALRIDYPFRLISFNAGIDRSLLIFQDTRKFGDSISYRALNSKFDAIRKFLNGGYLILLLRSGILRTENKFQFFLKFAIA